MNKTVIQNSERIYSFLLQFYPKKYRQEFGEEMKYVFSESLKDAYKEQGILHFWVRTVIDSGKSVIIQHLENQKEGNSMKKSLLRITLGTALLLMIPLLGRWPWTISDFILMAVLIFLAGLGIDLFIRQKSKNMNKAVIGIIIVLGILWLWVELAVGLFTNWGS